MTAGSLLMASCIPALMPVAIVTLSHAVICNQPSIEIAKRIVKRIPRQNKVKQE